jgi:hypothetical protein
MNSDEGAGSVEDCLAQDESIGFRGSQCGKHVLHPHFVEFPSFFSRVLRISGFSLFPFCLEVDPKMAILEFLEELRSALAKELSIDVECGRTENVRFGVEESQGQLRLGELEFERLLHN